MYKIKYLDTGHIFLLPEVEANRLKENFPFEYQILEKNGKKVREKIKNKPKEIDLSDIREAVTEK